MFIQNKTANDDDYDDDDEYQDSHDDNGDDKDDRSFIFAASADVTLYIMMIVPWASKLKRSECNEI